MVSDKGALRDSNFAEIMRSCLLEFSSMKALTRLVQARNVSHGRSHE